MLTLLEQHQANIAHRRLTDLMNLGATPPVPYSGDIRIQVCPSCHTTPTTVRAQTVCPVCKRHHDLE